MMKRILLAVLAVFVAWQVLDFVIHGLILMKSYQETASLWRPMNEMKFGLMRLVGLVAAGTFVLMYAWLVRDKSVATGLKFGLLFGLGTGASMGFGNYCVMPVPVFLAVVWFLGSVVEAVVAGLLVGWIVKETPPAALAPA
ncbi:MAG: hypothetical protein HZA90_02025 [Verrucomicrobia bacterium]|nr:hypothetical protein [Verrucomicrobiota bacterium]